MELKSHYQKIAEVRSFLLENPANVATLNVTPRFQDLHMFREKLHVNKKAPHFQLYTARKRSVRVYRFIFFLISMLFLGLAISSHYHSWHWSSQLIAANSTHLKGFLAIFCLLFSFSSLYVAYAMNTEKEATHQLYLKAKHRLSKIYARKQLLHGVRSFLAWGNFCRKAAALKHMYEDKLFQIHEMKDNTFHLLEKIYEAPLLDWKTREKLFNQAIHELQDHLEEKIIEFQHQEMLN